MAEANERIITDDTGKEILEAIRKIPGVTGATSIDHGGTGATTAEEALRNLGAQPKINVENVEEELGKMVKSVNSMTPDEHGNVHIAHVKTAENLTSDDAQDIYGEFIERTTGGTASITDGKSWIGIMEGNSVRTGYIPEDKSVNVVNMPREPITASIDWNAFRTAVDSSTTNILFSYNGTAWDNDLANYGITVVGYPIVGDSISVSFTEKSESYEVLSDGGITINVNWSTFESKYATDPVLYFTYGSGTWSANLAEYGIVVTGTPIDGDVINVQYVPEVRNMYVNPISRGETINAYVNWDIFRTAVSGSASTVTLLYTTEWSEPLSTYGVSISGSPIKGDQIELYFTPEVRGQIVNSTPTKFVSTGWNLYDNAKGYARVLKYSETYGFIISGTYTSVSFSETVDGATSPIAVDSSGNFDIPSDGYVHVIGGNASDTAIYMTWSDWTDSTPLTWSAYYESNINLSSLMQATFPFGLCSVGSASDDIDFSNKIATSRIERMEYNTTNLALARNSGREYAYDENYIYAVKEIPTSVGFSLDYELDAFDHGLERVEGTSVPVFIHMLYGQNLRDKLRTDVVTISHQNLTSAQKQQIRENLGLGGSAQLPIANGGTGAVDAAGARSNLGLGSAALKSVSASIAYGDLNLPTSNAVYSKIGNVEDVDLQSQITTLYEAIGNSKIINKKYYNAATTLAIVQTDIDSAIAPYVESGTPKFMQFGYMSGTAGRSIGLKDGCFINVYFNGSLLVLVEFIGMTLNEVNFMKKVTNWGSYIEPSLNEAITNTNPGQSLASNTDLDTVLTPGKYYASSNSTASTITHRPSKYNGATRSFSVDVVQVGALSRIMQIYYDYIDNMPFIRHLYNGVVTADWEELALDAKRAKLIGTNDEGLTGFNADFTKYHVFIIGLPDHMTTKFWTTGAANSEWWATATIYANSSTPLVVKNYCFKINSAGTGFFIDTTKSYQINFPSTGTPSIHQIENNKFYRVWAIAD